ncbi:MAG: radical SAM protein [Candidatus Sericytochromatia bacterium]
MSFPVIDLKSLDQMWFQISGTICNLSCEHCFISCSPKNNSFDIMDTDYVFKIIKEASENGLKEFYFTGGEPFVHKDILKILEYSLKYAPTTILTNGLLLKKELTKKLNKIHQNSIYSLEIRVSLDSYLESEHDKLRGKGSFRKALDGIKNLVENNFLPIITVTKTWNDNNDLLAQENLKRILNEIGYKRPRLKILPIIKIGKEAERGNSYQDYEYVNEEMLEPFDKTSLICSNSRIATSKGFYYCPILIDTDRSNLGNDFQDSFKPVTLSEKACYTCYMFGSICQNIQSGEKYAR